MTPSPTAAFNRRCTTEMTLLRMGIRTRITVSQTRPLQIPRRQDLVDEPAEDERRGQREGRGEQDGDEHPGQVPPVRPGVAQHAQQQLPRDLRFFLVGRQVTETRYHHA